MTAGRRWEEEKLSRLLQRNDFEIILSGKKTGWVGGVLCIADTQVIIYFNLLLYVTPLSSPPLSLALSLSPPSPNNIDFNSANFNSVFPTAPTLKVLL